MSAPGKGLTGLTTEELVEVVRLIHRETLPCPIQASQLMAMGLNKVVHEGALLVGLDRSAALAVLTAVIAERRRFAKRFDRFASPENRKTFARLFSREKGR